MTTTTLHLRESVAEAPTKVGNRWRVVVARPGKGSSGTYSAELFEKYAPVIVPAGGQAFLNHDFERNPKDMIGYYPEAAYWDAEDGPEGAVVTELEVFSHWKDFVEEVGPHCGISLYAMGEIDEDDNVISFHEDSYNGADLVSRPGLKGSGLSDKLYEEARKAATTESKQDSDRKESKMDEETKGKIDALIASSSALVTALTTKAEESAVVEDTEKTVAEALDAYETAVKAIDDADLFQSQVDALRAEAKTGKDVTPLIEQAKKVKEEAMAAATAEDETSTGRVLGENAKVTQYGAWS